MLSAYGSRRETAAGPRLQSWSAGRACLWLLRLDVVDRRIELLLELLDTIVDAMQIRAKADHLVDSLGGFLNMGIAHAAEPQLLSMERCSIRTVRRACRAKRDEGFVAGAELGVAEQPGDAAPFMLQLRVGHTVEPAGDRPQGLGDLVKDFLSGHTLPLLVVRPAVQGQTDCSEPGPFPF
jgi:hypothetical protein